MKNLNLDNLLVSIVDSLNDSIDANGYASLVVCGGKSPLPLYKKLSKIDIDWEKISIYLGDDRVVPHDHVDSNEKLIKDYLLINNARSAKFYSLLSPKLSINKIKFPFDIVLLGFGDDGHFASLFPGSNINLNDKPNLVMSDKPEGSPSYYRISMNLPMLLNTKRCILLVTNRKKRVIVDKAFTGSHMPLFFLINQDKTLIEYSDQIYF